MRTVLVTGAAGFIGSTLVDALLLEGHQVLGVDCFDPHYDPGLKRANLRVALASPRFDLVEADVRDQPAMTALVKRNRPSVVCHLAARVGVRASHGDPEGYLSVNVGGLRSLLDVCAAVPTEQLILASSSTVYASSARPPFHEDATPLRPASPYAESKLRGEELARENAASRNLPTTILRVFTTYGPRQRPDMAVHRFTDLLRRGLTIPLLGGGQAARDLTFVGDVVGGFLAAMRSPASMRTINLGAGIATPMWDVVLLLARQLGVEPHVERLPPAPGDVVSASADTTRARQLLGWVARTPIEEGVARFLAWYRSQPGECIE